jgi:EAL domain-containing protein (putative c-di-GMP-specific phosphodiesterase class I)
MESNVRQRASMEAELRQAILDEQLVLFYQAQVGSNGRTVGAEALLRWQHPLRGILPPMEFIPVAEETGLIAPLGHWVLERACRQLSAWAGKPRLAELVLSVNVSASELRRSEFLDHVSTVLDRTGANPQRLKLELTESVLVENAEEVAEKMAALKAMGVAFALDDFGTGYSSLSYLRRLPLDQLKIDRSLVHGVLTNPNDAAIARTVIALAQNLGLAVVAEGVETEAQRAFLEGSGCHCFQGYLFGMPLPAEAFEAMVMGS